jgi:hypothetical protein
MGNPTLSPRISRKSLPFRHPKYLPPLAPPPTANYGPKQCKRQQRQQQRRSPPSTDKFSREALQSCAKEQATKEHQEARWARKIVCRKSKNTGHIGRACRGGAKPNDASANAIDQPKNNLATLEVTNQFHTFAIELNTIKSAATPRPNIFFKPVGKNIFKVSALPNYGAKRSIMNHDMAMSNSAQRQAGARQLYQPNSSKRITDRLHWQDTTASYVQK